MKKYEIDLKLIAKTPISDRFCELVFTRGDYCSFDNNQFVDVLEQIVPGQFVEILIDTPNVFLRRPISVHFVDIKAMTLTLLVRIAGKGTEALCSANLGQEFNFILPLGNGFCTDGNISNPLLIGGGVGVAPLLYLGYTLRNQSVRPSFLLGARSKDELLSVEKFEEYGKVCISTDDGSFGEPGLVINNSVLINGDWDKIYCCGPLPMMKAVAKIAMQRHIACEVSLENNMACGLGACLCCVEDTHDGNVCVCKEGPVFDIARLKW